MGLSELSRLPYRDFRHARPLSAATGGWFCGVRRTERHPLVEYSYPQKWAIEREREVNYQVRLKGDLFGANVDSPIVLEALNVIENTFRGADYADRRDPVEFLMAATFEINRIQHLLLRRETQPAGMADSRPLVR